MNDTPGKVPTLGELLHDAPSNWGRWGDDDEVGALNFLTPDVILQAMTSVRTGKVFTLQLRMADPGGDLVSEGRVGAQRFMVSDKGRWLAGKGPSVPGGLEWADDAMFFFLQGSTQYDALGHIWFDDRTWNGYDARTTIGGLARASVLPLAERGVVGRGVLLDMARHRGKSALAKGEAFSHEDLLACAERQRCAIRPRDILVVRTGLLGTFYQLSREEFHRDFNDPGLTYSPALVEWFRAMEIPNLVTDTIANEVNVDPVSGVVLPLHGALMRNLGVVMTEMAWLDDLAADCDADGQYDFLYAAAPLKVVQGAGAPVNPLAIK